jgi:hypothetical protein
MTYAANNRPLPYKTIRNRAVFRSEVACGTSVGRLNPASWNAAQ